MNACFWPILCEMAIQRLITAMSVSLSSASVWRMGSIHVVITSVSVCVGNNTGGFVHCSSGRRRVSVGDVWPDLHLPVHIMTVIFRIVT